MPTITLIGCAFIILGMIFVAFTPKEKIVQVTAPQYGTMIAVMNAAGTEASGAAVPYAESDKILAWDYERQIYKWVSRADRDWQGE